MSPVYDGFCSVPGVSRGHVLRNKIKKEFIVIKMKKVKSSNIDSIGYDAEKKELHVRFKYGKKVYVYADVPADVNERFEKSASLGRFLGKEIKGKYEFETRDVEDGKKEEKDGQENAQAC